MSECSRLREHEGYVACDDVFHVKQRRRKLHIPRPAEWQGSLITLLRLFPIKPAYTGL